MGRVNTLSRWLIAISLIVMSISGFASNQLLDEEAFADLISNSVDSPQVRKLLATKAIDVAIDASDVDALLAAALPEELSLIATPALELSKPTLAEAGAQLLGLDAVGSSLDAAARSVHRQTSAAIVSDEETDVIINTLPVLVVVADQIAGDVGARAAVGLNLPDSATTINLGSNRSVAWTVVRSLGYVAGITVMVWLLSMIAYFVTAGSGRRLAAARRLGRTYIKVGIVLAIVTWAMLVVAAAALEIVLASGEQLSFAGISIGGFSNGGGIALAEVVFDPLVGSGRRMVINGLAMIVATYLLGSSAVSQAFRSAIRHRDLDLLTHALRAALPSQVRHTERALMASLAGVLLFWPQLTLRPAITLTLVVAAIMMILAVLTSTSPGATAVRRAAGWSHFDVGDVTDRSDRAVRDRRALVPVAALLALFWPSYDTAGFIGLVFLISAAVAATYWWELKLADETAENLVASPINESTWTLRRKLAVAAVVVLGAVLVGLGGDNTSPASASALSLGEPDACNGHQELCDRPLDQVIFAGTHNSMSASDLGWELANHKQAIPDQLDGGIRALLIDVQYWLQAESIASLGLDPEAAKIAAAALSVDTPPEDGLWMCHKLCQLGGTPFVDFLADLRVFVETNPYEVLIIVIQDEAPAVDIKAAIALAEIDRYAYTREPGEAWPTLGEMIEADERLVFMAENDAAETGWYQRAFDGNMSESGFRYSVVEDFDCAESRGGNNGAFFMINHWVETGLPVPSEADRVNSRQVLLDRVAECEVTRGRAPGIIAVNFWERGDLLQVVDELNQVAGS